ncbi:MULTISPECIES: hypothetical protein [unclassified Rathayibacter]|uniref:hypothetical protein n=1 Tax=unclassified Rathayibacter TaxID=2609250 RepID=UPI00188D77E9|nr:MULTISPECIES: hypothetical protein [unclassified Rathayibacter]MBF4463009.1 hypothetical protein [Rathayibacter sp. VKM Ac-2879]MBF4504423.1 hypothetical protein [Rathayibacter sp. VKM Ac-2878]
MLRGEKVSCMIWDQKTYWEVWFDENEEIEISEVSKRSNLISKILSDLDRQQFRLVEYTIAGLRLVSWVETQDGTPLIYDGDFPGAKRNPRIGRNTVVLTFG